MNHKIQIISATISDYPIIQNLARFYVYDRSGFMGWGCEQDGMFECIDFKNYFTDSNCKAFVVKVEGELAGFVLLDKEQITDLEADWNMGEFFIIAKFQGKGIADYVAREIFKNHPGKWSAATMPENLKAKKFWHKIIDSQTNGNFICNFRAAVNSEEYDMDVYEFEVMRDE